jgi:hypothetical protein
MAVCQSLYVVTESLLSGASPLPHLECIHSIQAANAGRTCACSLSGNGPNKAFCTACCA